MPTSLKCYVPASHNDMFQIVYSTMCHLFSSVKCHVPDSS